MQTDSQLDLKDLRLVRAIAEQGGVTAAARVLHVSQSAVSHHLTRIEERLGVELFRRAGRRLVITEAGNTLAALCTELGERMASVERELRGKAERFEIRLSTQCYTSYHWLPALLDDFARDHPRVRLKIDVDATRDPLRHLEEGRLDLALCHCDPPRGRRWRSRDVMRDRFVAVMARDHRLAGRKRISPRDLAGEVLLMHDLPDEVMREEGRSFFGGGAGPARVERIPLTEAIVQLVRAGRGMSIMSRWALTPYLCEAVVTVPIAGPQATRQWRAVYDVRSPLREPMEALVRQLASRELG